MPKIRKLVYPPFIDDANRLKEAGEKALQDLTKSWEKLRSTPLEAQDKNSLYELDRLSNEESLLFSAIYFYQNVHPDSQLRDAAQKSSVAHQAWAVERQYDEKVYGLTQSLAKNLKSLEKDEKKFLDDLLTDYRRLGLDLPKDKQEKLQGLQKEIGELAIQFSKNIQESNLCLWVERSELQGLPEDFINSLQQKDNLYRVSLEYPEYLPTMEYAEKESLREKLFRLKLSVAADENPELLGKVLKKRQEVAKLLGYSSWAAYVTEKRMAKSPERVIEFLEQIHQKIQKNFQTEKEELTERKRKHLNNPKAELQIWDVSFYKSRKIKEDFAVDSLEIKKYFPLNQILPRMFALFEKLFSLQIEENKGEFPTWHKEVRHYLVKDRSGDFIGSFYLDLHPREGKYQHAAAFSLVHGRQISETEYQAPLSAMVCNFPRGTKDKPATLSHSDVETLFHEFGHILHGILTKARFLEQSGTNVARDFVEAPSQVLENWVWEKESLQDLSSHFETGEPLPSELIEKMKAAKNFGLALHMCRQLSFGLTDMKLHAESSFEDAEDLYRETTAKVFLPVPEDSQFLAGFGHLMGYDAGYYGYAWADVMAADLFAVFKSKGILDETMGRKLREEIYEPGSSREENTSLEAFLGRSLSPEAFFQSIGARA